MKPNNEKGLLEAEEVEEAPEAEAAEEAAGDEEGEDSGLTPEQKAVADKAVDIATKALYENEKVSDMVVGMIRQEPFAQGIGDAAALITNTTVQQMKGALPREAAPSLLMFMVSEIMSVGAELGFFEPGDDLAADAAEAAAMSMDKLSGTNTLAAAEQLNAAEGGAAAPESAPQQPAGLLQGA
jgi:hypothetical protein